MKIKNIIISAIIAFNSFIIINVVTQQPYVVKDIATGTSHSSPSNFLNVNGTLFFSAADGINGFELWKSDGTDAGTMMVKDIRQGINSSNPKYLTNYNGIL